MSRLPEAHARALGALLDRLAGAPGLVWALTGSCSFRLQGMEVPVHDIDLITDEAGAYLIGGLLADCCEQEVSPSSAPYIRSHYGRFTLHGVQVEVMGASRRQNLDGSWGEPADLPGLIEHVTCSGLIIPVLSLVFEEQAYRLLRRDSRADQIAAFLLNRRQQG